MKSEIYEHTIAVFGRSPPPTSELKPHSGILAYDSSHFTPFITLVVHLLSGIRTMMTRRVLLGSYSSLTYDTQFTPPGPNSPPKLESAGTVNIGPRASWLLQHPIHRDIWYAAIEDDDEGGKKVGVRGKIEAYRLGGSDGREVEVLCSVSAGDNPCHIAIVQGGKALAATNVSSVFPPGLTSFKTDLLEYVDDMPS